MQRLLAVWEVLIFVASPLEDDMSISTRRFTSGDLEIREIMMTEVGDAIPDHDHYFPHTSIIFSGEFLVRVSNSAGVSEQKVLAGEHLLIEAEDMHYIECIRPGKVWCTFCHRDKNTGVPIPHANGWDQAYASRSDGR